MKIIVFFLLLFNLHVFADELQVKPRVDRPVLNENFVVDFIIHTSESGEPLINFNPIGVEVIDRGPTETSTRVTIINGERTMERTLTVSYELLPKKQGFIYLQNIEVEINGKILKHKTINLNVLKEPLETKKIFAKAEINKTKVYPGESIIVRYYLYSRGDVNLTGTEIKKFPKLDKFLKRFHQEQLSPERVAFDGKVYIRRIMYTAQLFANKPGTYQVDPISMRVSYSNRSNSFGGFGFNLQLGKPISNTIISPPVDIEVIGLPAEGMKPDFTGLVGDHEFSLKINKSKFIANEPIEIQMNVKGDGALELFEAPRVLSSTALEEFDKTSDLTVAADFTATKTINYTYIGRESVSLDKITIPVTYFSVKKNKYITKNLTLDPIQVAGGNLTSDGKIEKSSANAHPTRIENSSEEKNITIWEFRPIIKLANSFMYYMSEIFITCLVISLLILLVLIFGYFKGRPVIEMTDFQFIHKKGMTYGLLHKILSQKGQGESMELMIKGLNLSEPAEKYFIEMAKKFNSKFSTDEKISEERVNKKFLKELERKLKF